MKLRLERMILTKSAIRTQSSVAVPLRDLSWLRTPQLNVSSLSYVPRDIVYPHTVSMNSYPVIVLQYLHIFYILI